MTNPDQMANPDQFIELQRIISDLRVGVAALADGVERAVALLGAFPADDDRPVTRHGGMVLGVAVPGRDHAGMAAAVRTIENSTGIGFSMVAVVQQAADQPLDPQIVALLDARRPVALMLDPDPGRMLSGDLDPALTRMVHLLSHVPGCRIGLRTGWIEQTLINAMRAHLYNLVKRVFPALTVMTLGVGADEGDAVARELQRWAPESRDVETDGFQRWWGRIPAGRSAVVFGYAVHYPDPEQAAAQVTADARMLREHGITDVTLALSESALTTMLHPTVLQAVKRGFVGAGR